MFVTPLGNQFGTIRSNITIKIVVVNYIESLNWH